MFAVLLNGWWGVKWRLGSSGSPKDVRTVNVLGLLGLGDWLANLSMLKAIKEVFPACQLSVITNELGAQLLKNDPSVDCVLLIPATTLRWGKFLKLYIWTRAQAKARQADLVVCPFWHPTHQFLACLLAKKNYYGVFRNLTPFRVRQPDIIIPRESNLFEAAAVNQALALFSGKVDGPHVTQNDASWAEGQLRGLGTGRKILIVHPGFFWRNKAWPRDSWIEATRLIAQHIPIAVVLIGTEGEKPICDSIDEALRATGVETKNLCGETSVTQLAAILKWADLFLGTDSGPTHVAAAVGTLSVSLHGPTNPETCRPMLFKGRTIYHHLPCSPCGRDICLLEKKKRHQCMEGITPTEVKQVVLEVLDCQRHHVAPR